MADLFGRPGSALWPQGHQPVTLSHPLSRVAAVTYARDRHTPADASQPRAESRETAGRDAILTPFFPAHWQSLFGPEPRPRSVSLHSSSSLTHNDHAHSLLSSAGSTIGLPGHSQQNYMHELAKTLPPPRRQNVACDACRSVHPSLHSSVYRAQSMPLTRSRKVRCTQLQGSDKVCRPQHRLPPMPC